jgi:hypothetical protein
VLLCYYHQAPEIYIIYFTLLYFRTGNIPDDDQDHIIAIQHGIGNIPDDDLDYIIATTLDRKHSR